MAKTQAEIQRAYRERKKQQNPDYLKKERERQKSYRKKMKDLTKKEQLKRKAKNRLYGQTFRDKQKAHKTTVTVSIEKPEQSPTVTSSSPVAPSSGISLTEEQRALRGDRNPLLVKLSFPGKKRVSSSSLKKARLEISGLNQKIAELKRNEAKWKKRFQRLEQKTLQNQHVENNPPQESTMSPKTRTLNDLRSVQFTPRSGRSVKRKLLLANSILGEIKHTHNSNKEQRKKHVLAKILSGKITKKYRCMAMISKETGIGHGSLLKAQGKSIVMKRRTRLLKKRNQLRNKIVSFMERDDVSTMLPGKNDSTKQGKIKVQTRILTDYLANVYAKFMAEHPDVRISFSLFCRWRPKYIKLTSCITRNTCLCTRHQNMSMKLKAMKSLGLRIPQSAESASKSISLQDMKHMLDELHDKTIEYTYDEWMRVQVEDKKKMKVVKVTKSKDEFVQTMIKEYTDFLQHVDRVRTQYSALRNLKSNLPENHLIAQMDFAENFTCASNNEIQSAYWNATNVTLHPVVIYFKTAEGDVGHKNFVFVSDVNHHNATAVVTIIEKMMSDVKQMFPHATTIHYWTDSPSSQYRNRFIFDTVIHHEDRYGIKARWNFFESGHGKGPCDGLGGSAKRQAADAIKQGKTNIQDANDFFKWATDNQKSINYRFYNQAEYDKMGALISNNTVKSFPGTMKMHAIYPTNTTLYTRETSCYCDACLIPSDNENLCKSWSPHILQQKDNQTGRNDNDFTAINQSTVEHCAVELLEAGLFIVAIYDKKRYVGKIIDIDNSDETVNVSFMEKSKGKGKSPTFKWPNEPDELWLNISDVICKIEEPLPTGKTCRQFILANPDDVDIIMQ